MPGGILDTNKDHRRRKTAHCENDEVEKILRNETAHVGTPCWLLRAAITRCAAHGFDDCQNARADTSINLADHVGGAMRAAAMLVCADLFRFNAGQLRGKS